jgi:histidyl-tRNA synthetase
MQYQVPKGLFDILPYGSSEEWQLSDRWQFLESIMRKAALDYGFKEIRTPLLESTDLFIRGVGEQTDIVSKEMYTFLDKGGRSLTLRPEGTAAVMRAFLEHHLPTLSSVHKFYYIAPMFRYERQQSGRYRQHHQFGVEALGIGSFEQDAEVIDLLLDLYQRLGLKNIKLMINSLGDAEDRQNYRNALVGFLTPHISSLSEESKQRLQKNPLRILDSKSPEDQALLEKAPSMLEFLGKEAKSHFQGLLDLLTKLSVPFTINEKLVRGFDYYNRTVFEVVCQSLGAQNAIGGGGRYDSLLADFGGPNLPGIGFGTGLERILQSMHEQKIAFPNTNAPFVYLLPVDSSAKEFSFLLGEKLRHQKIPVEIDLESKKIQKALQKADKAKASFAVLIGEEEWKNKKAQIKNMQSREQEEVSLDHLLEKVVHLWKLV